MARAEAKMTDFMVAVIGRIVMEKDQRGGELDRRQGSLVRVFG